jgi:hypothetical protein
VVGLRIVVADARAARGEERVVGGRVLRDSRHGEA